MRPRTKGFRENICKYFEECTGTTSIHGVKFIGDRNRSNIERLIWLIIWITSVAICTKYVMQTYRKWENSPVFVTIGTGQVPIQDISFPAITICPESNIDSDIFYYPDMLNLVFANDTNLTETQQTQFEYITMICNRTGFDDENLMREYFDEGILNFFHNVTLPIDKVFKKCRFASTEIDCTEIFTPIFYKDGICYSFNILDHSEMFHKSVQRFMGYNSAPKSVCLNQPFTKECKNVYPKRASFSGVDVGLQVELTVREKDLDFQCGSPLQGYKVILHDPSELPTPIHNNFRVPPEEAVFISVTPEVIITEKDLRSYPAEQRKCYFDDEKVLKKFRRYSQVNCEAECLQHLMHTTFDCLDFYLPHTNATQHICGPKYLAFMVFIEQLLINYVSDVGYLNLTPEQEELLKLLEKAGLANESKTHCACLPSCSSIDYAFQATQTDYHWRRFSNSENLKEYRSLLNIYFKQPQFIPLQRKEMFGSMDFIAYCGGLLGLFIGFSFISMVEVIYFLSLRIGCNVRKYGRRAWYGPDNE